MSSRIIVRENCLDQTLIYLLRQANAASIRAADQELDDFAIGITLAQFYVLKLIETQGDISGAELSRMLMITPQSASRTINSLEFSLLVEREPKPNNECTQLLRLTRQGHYVVEFAQYHVETIEQRIWHLKGCLDMADAKKWLSTVVRRLSEDRR